jgi:hypothetical protein
MLGRKFYFRNIIPNDFGNTVKELVISWFFGFRSSKHNIAVYVGRKCGTTGYDQDSTVSTILTLSQSGPIDWNLFKASRTTDNNQLTPDIQTNEHNK